MSKTKTVIVILGQVRSQRTNLHYKHGDDIMRAGVINFSDILLEKKHMKTICDFSYKILWLQNHCIFASKRIDRFIKIYDGIRYLVLLYDRINYLMILHIVLIIILQELELIHVILYLQKKNILKYSLSQLLIRIILTTNINYF